MVFFTATEHERASVGDISFLTKACGIPWPSEPKTQYNDSLLAPCRHGSKSIRELFGYSEKPSAIQPGGKSVLTIGQALAHVLSFALSPMAMTALCATAKRVNETCGTPEAWIGNAVDTRGIRPSGKRAYNHFALWRQTRYVISGKWCQGNVALLISLHPWQWDIEGEKHGGLFVSISTSLAVCSARFFLPKPATDLIVAFASCNVVRTLVAAVKKGIKKREIVHGFRFEAGSASLIVNNKELFWQPVLPLDGLVHIIHEDGEMRVSSDTVCVSLPLRANAGRRLALIAEEGVDAWPCW